jgi:hypothetical protein
MARASKKTEGQLSAYRSCIESAKGFRRQEDLDGRDGLWATLVDLYKGKHWPKNAPYKDLITINISKATVDVILPSIAINYPSVTITALTPEAFDGQVILEAVINYWWRHFDVMPEVQAAVKDYLITGHGWLKVGYRYVEEEQPDYAADDDLFEQKRAEVEEYAEANPHLAGDLPTDDEIKEEVGGQTKLLVVEDRPFVERVSTHDVYVDPEATSMRDISWIAQRVVKTLRDVRDNEDYNKTARREIEADEALDTEWLDWDPNRREAVLKDDIKRVTLWEFYDVRRGTTCTFAESGMRFLVEPEEIPYDFGHPFLMLRNYEVPDQFYPMGELEALEGLQNELNYTRTSMLNDAKAQRRRWLYRADALGQKAREALTSDEDNIGIPIEGQDPLDSVIAQMPSNTVNAEMYQNNDVIMGDINTVTAISEYQRGDAPEIRRTATEASIIQDAANARAAFKLSQIERYMGEVAEYLSKLAQEFVDEKQTSMITGKNGQPFWFEFDSEDIQGEYAFSVEAGSTEPKNEVTRRRTALDLLQALGPLMAPNPDGSPGLINVPNLLTHVLESGFGIKQPEKFLTAPVDPVTEGMGDPVMAEQQKMAQQLQGAPALPPGMEGGEDLPPEVMMQLMAELGLTTSPGAPPAPLATGPSAPPGGLPPGTVTGAGASELPPELIALLTQDPSGADAIPPEILAQLQGQVGLQV